MQVGKQTIYKQEGKRYNTQAKNTLNHSETALIRLTNHSAHLS